MQRDVDLRGLAVRREEEPRGREFGPPPRPFTRYVLPAVLLAGFLSLAGWAMRDALNPGRPVTIAPVLTSTAEVRRGGTPLFKAAGWVEPRPFPIHVAALAPGVVEGLLVVEDQAVEEGEPVARLVARDAELALEAAEATLALRRGELAQAEAMRAKAETNFAQPVYLEAELAAAEAELAKVETELTNLPFELRQAEARERVARIDLESMLNAPDAIAAIAVERARGALDAAAAEVNAQRERRRLLEAQRRALVARRDALRKQLELKAEETGALADAKAKVRAAEAAVRQAEVALAEAKLRLERMTVRAPVAGRVLHLLAAPGTQVGIPPTAQPGRDLTGSVVTMYQPDRLQARVDVRFEDLPKVRRGQPVLIENRALPRPLEGTVLFLSSLANIQKNTLEVKVSIDAPPPVFKPDMLVDVTFLAPEQEGESPDPGEFRLLVPRQLVEGEGEAAVVWVADLAAGVARRQPVRLGAALPGEMVEVVGGLNAASRLIVEGRQGLKDGAKIRVTGEDATVGAGHPHPPGERGVSTPRYSESPGTGRSTR